MIRYHRANHVAWRRVGDETVVVHLGRKLMLAFNEPGAAVWNALEREHDPVAIARVVLDGAEGAAAAEAVEAFLQELGREGVVEADPAGGESLGAVAGPTLAGGPAVAWREELRAFGVNQCGFFPAGGGPCQGNPHRS